MNVNVSEGKVEIAAEPESAPQQSECALQPSAITNDTDR